MASLAASLSLAGAAVVLDKDKLRQRSALPLFHIEFESRFWFGVVLCLALALFLMAAIVAVTAHQGQNDDIANEEKCNANWKAAKDKHSRVTASLWLLVGGMAVVLALAFLATIAPPPIP